MYGFRGLLSITSPKRGAELRAAGRIACVHAACQYGEISDLSRSGMRVRCKRSVDIRPGDQTKLHVGGLADPLILAAKAVWRRAGTRGWHEVGFAFEPTDAAARSALAELARVAGNNELIGAARAR